MAPSGKGLDLQPRPSGAGRCDGAQSSMRSTTVAIPCPTPMHIEARP